MTRQLDFNVTVLKKSQLIHTAADPAVHHITTPHQPPPSLSGTWGKRWAWLSTEDVGGVFQVDLQALRHSRAHRRKHERTSVVSYADLVVVKQDTCLGESVCNAKLKHNDKMDTINFSTEISFKSPKIRVLDCFAHSFPADNTKLDESGFTVVE